MSADPPRDEPVPGTPSPLRVASVPFSDRYVDAVLPPGAVRVGPEQEPSRWLDEEYLVEHAG